jgi:hypothetical protein
LTILRAAGVYNSNGDKQPQSGNWSFLAVCVVQLKRTHDYLPNHRWVLLKMPPMSFFGVVTKAGFMNKTATVTVSRWVIDKKTGKVRDDQLTS